MKKLIPALSMLLISAMLLGTSTFAWFSMNNKVNVTGMEVKTQVSDSLYIAKDTVSGAARYAKDAANWKFGYVEDHTVALIEPVSTKDGVSYFYNSTKNATATGDAQADTYIAYAAGTGFDDNYGTTGAVGYVDYAFQLKAENTTAATTKYVNLSTITLTYAGPLAAGATMTDAFRVAVFVEDLGAEFMNGSTATTTNPSGAVSTTTLKSILANTTAAADLYYTTSKAVASTTALDDVSSLATKTSIGTVAAQTTHYFKVVVRLWIEGEDKTCTSSTFANLTDAWALDLACTLDTVDTNGVTSFTLTTPTAKLANLGGAPLSGSTAKVVDGVSYYEITDNAGLYLKSASTAVASDSVIYKIDSNNIVTDVTNQCTLPTA